MILVQNEVEITLYNQISWIYSSVVNSFNQITCRLQRIYAVNYIIVYMRRWMYCTYYIYTMKSSYCVGVQRRDKSLMLEVMLDIH